jgi:crossover junction endodeoxyribonuclease RusA
MKFFLPWPSSKLNPNQRLHFAHKAKIAGAAKTAAYMIAKPLALEHKFVADKIPTRIIFHQPDRRSRDLDNLLSSLKSSLDGVALALGINDKRFRPITIDFADQIVKGGSVEIFFDEPQIPSCESSSLHV